jgi:hypothetical protein
VCGRCGARDVITSRCAWSPLYGRPAAISTVDKYVPVFVFLCVCAHVCVCGG